MRQARFSLSDPGAYQAFLDEMEKLSADPTTRRRMRGVPAGRASKQPKLKK